MKIRRGVAMPWPKQTLLLICIFAPLAYACKKDIAPNDSEGGGGGNRQIEDTNAPMVSSVLGSGWTEYSPTKKIHLDDQAGLQTFNWTSYKSVGNPICADYRYESGTETFRLLNTQTNRSEIRLQNEYSSGSRQFEGYVKFSAPLNDESLMQIFGSTSGATQLMIRGYSANGGSITGGGQTLATNCYGQELKINVIHLQENVGNRIKIYVNGVKKADIADNEAVTNYMKYGNYGTLTTGTATVQWRNVKVYKDGTAPN
ncbi:hypothetical protein [Chitinophaga barathri]|uniref:DUF1080 domain-containing protein n=1 Tax=Chitinophaga barathri TaxID=1647451 RepID=A0A3N4MMF2_9BACT|nr:hypothetical protein [Chitinophaga barathri]RPD43236.1 hypothetical protein EG028_02765 [Chitinophaga barathri]